MDTPNRPQPTSMRLHADDLALLDAIADYQRATKGGRWSRTETVRQLLKRVKPPESEAGVEAAAWRRAYQAAFSRHEEAR